MLEVLKDSLPILAIGVPSILASCKFVSKAEKPLFLATAAGALGCTILLNQYQLWVEGKIEEVTSKPNLSDSKKKTLSLRRFSISYLTPLSLSLLMLLTRNPLVHELGHVFVAKCLFKNKNPEVGLSFFSGSTKVADTTLNSLGTLIGQEKTTVAFSAGGPLFGVILAIIDLGIARFTPNATSNIKKIFQTMAIVNIAHHSFYAFTALFQDTLKNSYNNDFYVLWKKGNIHPVFAISCMVAIPLLFQGFLSFAFPKEAKKQTV